MLLKQVGMCIHSYGQRLLFKKNSLAGGVIGGNLPGPEPGVMVKTTAIFRDVIWRHLKSGF